MKLNPLKCVFGVSSRQILRLYGNLERDRGQPIQIKSIMNSQAPTARKGCAATDWSIGISRAIHIPFHRPIKTIFYHSKGSQKGRLE